MNDKTLSYLGIAKKAGRLAVGVPAVCDALRRGAAHVVFVVADASAPTKKRVTDKCRTYGARLYELDAAGVDLAHRVGSHGSVAAAAITDRGLANAASSAFSRGE